MPRRVDVSAPPKLTRAGSTLVGLRIPNDHLRTLKKIARRCRLRSVQALIRRQYEPLIASDR